MKPFEFVLPLSAMLVLSACTDSVAPSPLPPVVSARLVTSDSLEVTVAVPRGAVAWSVSTCPIIGEERRGAGWTPSDRIGTQNVQCPFPLLVVQPGSAVRTTVPVASVSVPADGYRVGVQVEPVVEGATTPSDLRVYSESFALPTP